MILERASASRELAPPPRGFIVLSGFMGAGKSTVGRLLASALAMPFVDLDAALEADTGQTVATLLEAKGEAVFRDLEAAALIEALGGPPAVISVGGGTMTRSENRAAARLAGVLVTLAVSPETAAARIVREGKPATRPLFDLDALALAARAANRASAYADADLIVDTEGRDPEAVLAALRSALAARGAL